MAVAAPRSDTPYGYDPGQLTLLDRLIAASAHLAILLSLPGLIYAAVLWLTLRRRSPFISWHARQGLLWQSATTIALLLLLLVLFLVAFFSFGDSLYGGLYYDTQLLENVLKPECLLAFERNGQPLTGVYGAPLRLRVENQLGYKMVKWIERIEFIQSEKQLGKGEGGKNEDDEYFDLLPNI